MYIYSYIPMYIYSFTWTFARIHMHLHMISVYMCMHMYFRMHECMCRYMYMHVYVYICIIRKQQLVYTFICSSDIRTCTNMASLMHPLVCCIPLAYTFTYTHAHMHTRMYIYIYTYMKVRIGAVFHFKAAGLAQLFPGSPRAPVWHQQLGLSQCCLAVSYLQVLGHE